jgi:formylglycine-generating enzyme required for sulfatase activity
MKTKLCLLLMTPALLAGINSAVAQPVITSFSQNGALVCSNLAPGGGATILWASSLSGPWRGDWTTLTGVAADSNGMIHVSVPMFYRVFGVTAPSLTNGMVLIPAGSFTMGDTLDGAPIAVPTNIYVSAFYMDTNLVSYALWEAVCTYAANQGYDVFDNRGSGKAWNHPVQTVDWYNCVKWCNARSQLAGLTPVYYINPALTQVYTWGSRDAVYVNWAANGFRLPTEAEWEKAARGGLSGQRFPWGLTISESQANYFADTYHYPYDLGPYDGPNTNFMTGGVPYTSPVGYFAPNGYGLYDMAGNVEERCWDWYGTPYGQPTTNNPTGPASGTYRVQRGGSWSDTAELLQCARRINDTPGSAQNYVGFRCVRGF